MSNARRGALLMASGTFVSRALGVVRNATLVSAIGVNLYAANAFDVANKLPNILFALLAAGMLNAVLVPQVVRAYNSANGEEIINKLLTAALMLMAGLTLILTLAAPLVIRLYIDNWTSAQTSLAITFGFWCIPQLLFYGIYTLLGQVLNAREQFGPYMWAPVLNNVISIAGFVVFICIYGSYNAGVTDDMSAWTGAKIALLAGTATGGIVAQAFVLLIPLYRTGFRWRLRMGWRGIGLKTTSQVALWTLIAGIVEQAGLLLVTRIATAAVRVSNGSLDVAGNAAYSNAILLYVLPHSLVTVSISVALFTRISKAAADKDLAGVQNTLSQGVRVVGVFTVFAAAYLIVAALPLVILTLPSAGLVQATTIANVLQTMAPALIGLGLTVMLRNIFFAFEDGRSVFWLQLPATLLLVIGSQLAQWHLPVQLWVVGIGAAMSVSELLVSFVRLALIRTHVGSFDLKKVTHTYLIAVIAATGAVVVGYLTMKLLGSFSHSSWLGAALSCLIVGLMMAITYIAGLRRFKAEELHSLLGPLVNLSGKLLGPKQSRILSGLLLPPVVHEDGPTLRHDWRNLDAAPMVRKTIAAGTVIAGRYRLQAPQTEVYAGAETWFGVDTILDTKVQVRIVHDRASQRVLEELRSATQVLDPALPRTLAAGMSPQGCYQVTAPVTGPTLGDVVRAGALEPAAAGAIVAEVARLVDVCGFRHSLVMNPDRLVLHTTGITLLGLGSDIVLTGREVLDPVASDRQDVSGLASLLLFTLAGIRTDNPAAHSGKKDLPRDTPAAFAELIRVATSSQGPRQAATFAAALGEVGDLRQELSEVLDRYERTLATEFEPPEMADQSAKAPASENVISGYMVLVDDVDDIDGLDLIADDYFVEDEPEYYIPQAGSDATLAGSLNVPRPDPGPSSRELFNELVSDPKKTLTTRRFNLGPVIVGVVTVALLWLIWFAFSSIFAPTKPPVTVVPSRPAATDLPFIPITPSEDTKVPGSLPPSPSPSGAPSASGTGTGLQVPKIAAAQALDPGGDGNEHPELLANAYDGDANTDWYTRTYRSDSMLGKPGLGYFMTFKAPATISGITLQSPSNGGNIEIRKTDAKNPAGGTLLAAGPMNGNTTFKFKEPVTTDSLLIWVTKLPISDGSYRMDIYEITFTGAPPVSRRP